MLHGVGVRKGQRADQKMISQSKMRTCTCTPRVQEWEIGEHRALGHDKKNGDIEKTGNSQDKLLFQTTNCGFTSIDIYKSLENQNTSPVQVLWNKPYIKM